jgi:hypothetical protein
VFLFVFDSCDFVDRRGPSREQKRSTKSHERTRNEKLILAPPHKIQSLNDIKADPAHWDRKQIIYEGTYQHRFEVSALERNIVGLAS